MKYFGHELEIRYIGDAFETKQIWQFGSKFQLNLNSKYPLVFIRGPRGFLFQAKQRVICLQSQF